MFVICKWLLKGIRVLAISLTFLVEIIKNFLNVIWFSFSDEIILLSATGTAAKVNLNLDQCSSTKTNPQQYVCAGDRSLASEKEKDQSKKLFVDVNLANQMSARSGARYEVFTIIKTILYIQAWIKGRAEMCASPLARISKKTSVYYLCLGWCTWLSLWILLIFTLSGLWMTIFIQFWLA